jgi:hypothetical protein
LGDSVLGKYRWDDETGWIARGDQDRCAKKAKDRSLIAAASISASPTKA